MLRARTLAHTQVEDVSQVTPAAILAAQAPPRTLQKLHAIAGLQASIKGVIIGKVRVDEVRPVHGHMRCVGQVSVVNGSARRYLHHQLGPLCLH
jgi:hypothetical protein